MLALPVQFQRKTAIDIPPADWTRKPGRTLARTLPRENNFLVLAGPVSIGVDSVSMQCRLATGMDASVDVSVGFPYLENTGADSDRDGTAAR